jgi:hypothetical protein
MEKYAVRLNVAERCRLRKVEWNPKWKTCLFLNGNPLMANTILRILSIVGAYGKLNESGEYWFGLHLCDEDKNIFTLNPANEDSQNMAQILQIASMLLSKSIWWP